MSVQTTQVVVTALVQQPAALIKVQTAQVVAVVLVENKDPLPTAGALRLAYGTN